MYTVECHICGEWVRSEFWDMVQDHIDACFDKATPFKQGRLGHVTIEFTPALEVIPPTDLPINWVVDYPC